MYTGPAQRGNIILSISGYIIYVKSNNGLCLNPKRIDPFMVDHGQVDYKYEAQVRHYVVEFPAIALLPFQFLYSNITFNRKEGEQWTKRVSKNFMSGTRKKIPYKIELSIYETGYEVIREAKNMNQKILQM